MQGHKTQEPETILLFTTKDTLSHTQTHYIYTTQTIWLLEFLTTVTRIQNVHANQQKIVFSKIWAKEATFMKPLLSDRYHCWFGIFKK